MSTPLDKIFEESINNCYSDFRWLDTYTVDDKGKIFNISDFIKCFQQTFDEIGYTGDAKNIGRAGVVRLNSLVNLFDNYFSIPIEAFYKNLGAGNTFFHESAHMMDYLTGENGKDLSVTNDLTSAIQED